MTTTIALAKATGGVAAIVGAALGDAMGRAVNGLASQAATLRVASSDTAVAFIQPPAMENDAMREALPGTPSAATMRGLMLLEAAYLGPADPEALVEDALRRACIPAFPSHARHLNGALLAPSPVYKHAIGQYSQGLHALSCASVGGDASLLTAAAILGAGGVPMDRAALLLRATCRDPVTLCACITLSEIVRELCVEEATPEWIVQSARRAEEQALACVRSLPGTLSRPAEMGHGALAMSLARAASAQNAADALLELSRDVAETPEIVLGAVLGAVRVEGEAVQKIVATALRQGNASSAAVSALLAIVGAVHGLKVVPLTWLQTMQEADALHSLVEKVDAKKHKRLDRPAVDVCWQWARAESAYRAEREIARRTQPPPVRKEQLTLFGELNSPTEKR